MVDYNIISFKLLIERANNEILMIINDFNIQNKDRNMSYNDSKKICDIIQKNQKQIYKLQLDIFSKIINLEKHAKDNMFFQRIKERRDENQNNINKISADSIKCDNSQNIKNDHKI
jgi:hypothetical protein